MVEDKYTFDDEEEEKKGGFISKLSGFGNFIWNSETKEFCGRDGMSWAKVSFFYFIFYTCLGAFFIGMLAVFFAVTPKDVPTYYGHSSVMDSRSHTLNPGLGFRPQIDPEDHVIKFSSNAYINPKIGSSKYIQNLENFLESKYDNQSATDTIDCVSGKTYEDEFKRGKSCKFDYKKIFKDTKCTQENKFNYNSPNPCVLIKINKIVSWVPKFENETSTNYIRIVCAGENIVDRDNVKKVTYHSEDNLNNTSEGQIQAKHFPFWGKKQSSYRAPFIWVEFDVSPNTLVNIECKAFAGNIDHDRQTRRGQTKFSLYIDSTSK